MQQDRNIYNEETHRTADRPEHDGNQTGRNLPDGDGDVGDEQVNAIEGGLADRPTGQDHSTEGHERTEPTGGVGGAQDDSQPTKSRAAIDD